MKLPELRSLLMHVLFQAVIFNRMYRTEKDSLGEKQIPSDALYGIHAYDAVDPSIVWAIIRNRPVKCLLLFYLCAYAVAPLCLNY